MTDPSDGRAASELRVDPITCRAHGLCADLLPEVVDLDEWGYPMTAPGPLPRHLRRRAADAVAACPTLALRLGTAPDRSTRPITESG